MTDSIELKAEPRTDRGKSASRLLRREADSIPAIIYGANKAPQSLTLVHKDVFKALEQEAFSSSILTINIAGKKEKAVLKDLQRHHSKPKVLHLDFLRVSAKEPITMNVPLHFLGEEESPGVKEGGIVTHNITDIEIKCLPENLPEFIEIEISQLGLDQTLHISDLNLPEGVELTLDLSDSSHNLPLVSIHTPKVIVEEEVVPEEAAVEGEEAEAKAEAEKPAETDSKESAPKAPKGG